MLLGRTQFREINSSSFQTGRNSETGIHFLKEICHNLIFWMEGCMRDGMTCLYLIFIEIEKKSPRKQTHMHIENYVENKLEKYFHL